MAAGNVQMTEEQVASIANEFGQKLQGIFEFVELRLFGSYLKNNANQYSDLDLAVVSRDFAGMEPYTAMKILQRIKLQVNNVIEPIPLTPEELASPEIGTLCYDIAQNNKVLFKAPF
jgi:predicted nucleotidyltransferase